LKQTVQVTILGQQYSIKSETDPEEVRRVADFVNQRIAEAHAAMRTNNSFTVVVLVLLNVAGELFQLQTQGGGGVDGAGEIRLRQLLARIEAACEEPAAAR
jgi:cell division protein ZapA